MSVLSEKCCTEGPSAALVKWKREDDRKSDSQLIRNEIFFSEILAPD